jgi:hypothetical protein
MQCVAFVESVTLQQNNNTVFLLLGGREQGEDSFINRHVQSKAKERP